MGSISTWAFLGCAACARRAELAVGWGLVFAGVFGAWVFSRPRYEPGRGCSTLCWTAFAALAFLGFLVAGGEVLWVPFLAFWTVSLVAGVIREQRLRHKGGCLPIDGNLSVPAAPSGHSFGFNASILVFFVLAVVLRLGTIRLASASH